MNETQYHQLADDTLERLSQALEKADAQGLLELEVEGGMVTIALDDGKQFIISKHVPTRQLWLSSPISGGLHFSHDDKTQDWRLPDQRSLMSIVLAELGQIAGIVL